MDKKLEMLLSVEQKRQLLKAKLEQRAAQQDSVFPLSFGQEALWFSYKLVPSSAAYNIAFACRLLGPLDQEKLERSFQAVIDRHASLRTTFPESRGQAKQYVHGYQKLKFELVDSLGWNHEKISNEVSRAYAEPFDLANGPLFRCHLFRVGSQEHILLLSAHHIIGDGWSMWMVLDEWRQLYLATEGAPLLLVRPKYEYHHFVESERNFLGSPEGKKQLNFWYDQLAGELPILDLPHDFPRTTSAHFNGASISFGLDRKLSDAMRKIAKDNGVTLFAALLSTYHTFLHRYSGQDTVVVGTPSARRTDAKFMDVVGYFVQLVPVRSDLNRDMTFRRFMLDISNTMLEAMQRQDVPLSAIVDKLGVSRTAGAAPLFQTTFMLQKSQRADAFADLLLAGDENVELALGDLVLKPFPLAQQEGQFDITLEMIEVDSNIRCALKYDTELFAAETVERMARHYVTLVEDCVQRPDTSIDELYLCESTELDSIIRAGSGSTRSLQGLPFLHESVLHQCELNPNRPAIICNNDTLNFEQLGKRVSVLAAQLRGSGIGNGDLVGVYGDRSIGLVVSLLAVMHAGAAFVTLDPSYPEERIRHIAQSASIDSTILINASLPGALAGCSTVILVEPDTGLSDVDKLDSNDVVTKPEQKAYVMYTSGSTGRPKGVEVTQSNLVNFCLGMNEVFGHEIPHETWLAITSVSFDISILELLWTLTNGSTVVVLETSASMTTTTRLETLIEQHGVNCIQCTPSFAAVILAIRQESDALKRIKRTLIGGEALPPALAEALLIRTGGRLYNMYGPTETTIWSTVQEVQLGDLWPVSIGLPICNTQALVLSHGARQLVPTGVIGELYIGGEGVTRGYIGASDLTDAAFVSVPALGGEIFYATGDMARNTNDGRLQLLGRVDSQVKIRGRRIEPAEIEYVFGEHHAVKRAIVLPDIRDDQVQELICYVLVDSLSSVTVDDLRVHAEQLLQKQMVPRSIVPLLDIPLLPNGKVNRRALPEPAGTEQLEYVGPRDDKEKSLVEVIEAVLERTGVGIHDNFFALGGDSIKSIQAVSLARESGLDVNASLIFQHQSVAELAAAIKRLPTELTDTGVVYANFIKRLSIGRWYASQFKSQQIGEITLRCNEPISIDQIQLAVNVLSDRHDVLSADNRPTCTSINPSENFKQNESPDQAVPDQQAPIELILSNSAKEPASELLVRYNRCQIDEASVAIFVEELEYAYAATCSTEKSGSQSLVPIRSLSYNDWAKLQLEHEQKTIVRGGDSAMPANGAARMKRENITSESVLLDVALTQELIEIAPIAYRTQLKDQLITTLLLVCAAHCQKDRIVVELRNEDRRSLAHGQLIEKTIGLLGELTTNVFKNSPECSVAECLVNVKERLRSCADMSDSEPDVPVDFTVHISSNDTARRHEGQIFSQVEASRVYDLAPDAHSLSASFEGNRLRVSLNRGVAVDGFKLPESFIDDFERTIRDIVEHCSQPNAGALTPSDAPLIELSQNSLTQIESLALSFGIDRNAIETVLPVAHAQEALLYLTTLSADTTQSINQLILRIRGSFDTQKFEQAWRLVIQRHQALRTTFFTVGLDHPVQVVLRDAAFSCSRVSFDKPSQDCQQQLEALRKRDQSDAFNLTCPPLFRAQVVEMSDSTEVQFSYHNTLLDGWSLSIIFREILSLYSSVDINQLSDTMTPPVNVEHYLKWLAEQDRGSAKKYWQKQLRGLEAATTFRASGTGATEQASFGGSQRHKFALPASVTARLPQFISEHRITLSVVLQAAWALVLSRFSGDDDIVYGVVQSGRSGELNGVDGLVGMLIQTVPARLQLDWDKAPSVWLAELLSLQVDRERYGYLPLDHIHECSDVLRSTPLFNSIVVVENYPLDPTLVSNGGIDLEKFDLLENAPQALALFAKANGPIELGFLFDPAVYSSSVIKQLEQYTTVFLERLCDGSDEAISDLVQLTESDYARMRLHGFGPQPQRSSENIFLSKFQKQVGLFPDAPAVLFGNKSFSYSELDVKSERFAAWLACRGVSEGGRIGLCLERTPEILVVMIGVWRAGCSYVPLDSTSPTERLRYIVDDSAADVVVFDNDRPAWSDGLLCETLLLSEFDEWTPTASVVNKDHSISDADPAYAIYTSGSTGKPKGVLVGHSALANLLCGMQEELELNASDVVLGATTLAFDISVMELFLPLTIGASVRLLNTNEARDAAALQSVLVPQGDVTVVQATPATWKMLIADGWQAEVEIKALSGGEVMTTDLRDALLTRVACLWNGYGPTEATIYSLVHKVPRASMDESVSIGKPIANTGAIVMDHMGRLVPDGVIGELYIGGDGLAIEYLKRPALTADRFVEEPDGVAGRWYRTGDLVAVGADGDFEYHGRTDNQVKVRGHRIELGEIEAVFRQLPNVVDAVVVPLDSENLGSYLILDAVSDVDKSLRAVLSQARKRLPRYMVPGRYLALDEFPLDGNGKVDRRNLPEIGMTRSLSDEEYVAPRTETEKVVASMCAELLGIERIGIYDSFFDLGGHSLLAAQLLTRIRHEFGVKLEVVSFFDEPIVADVAEMIDTLRWTSKVDLDKEDRTNEDSEEIVI